MGCLENTTINNFWLVIQQTDGGKRKDIDRDKNGWLWYLGSIKWAARSDQWIKHNAK